MAAADGRAQCSGVGDLACVHRRALALPAATPPTVSHPSHLAVDPAGDALWIADIVGAVLTRLPLDGGDLEQFPLSAPTADWSFFGAFDWQLRVTDGAVYVIEYGDNQILRFDTTDPGLASCRALVEGANPCVREVFLPIEAATLNAHSIDVDGDRLWFTVANEAGSVRDPADTYIGYLDLTTWAGDGPPEGVLYTGSRPSPRWPRGITARRGGSTSKMVASSWPRWAAS